MSMVDPGLNRTLDNVPTTVTTTTTTTCCCCSQRLLSREFVKGRDMYNTLVVLLCEFVIKGRDEYTCHCVWAFVSREIGLLWWWTIKNTIKTSKWEQNNAKRHKTTA